MSFVVPDSTYGLILAWLMNVLKDVSFIEGVTIYESDFFITSSTKIPAIAIQRGILEEEDDENEKCVGAMALKTDVAITLHIPPTENETLNPILHYFEETVIKEVIKAYLTGNPPSNLQYLRFKGSLVSNLFERENNTVFSNMSQVKFSIGYTV